MGESGQQADSQAQATKRRRPAHQPRRVLDSVTEVGGLRSTARGHALADELGRWARLQVMGAGTGDGKVVSPLPGGGGGPQGAGGNSGPTDGCGDGHKSGSDSSDAGGVEKLLDEDKDTHHQDKDTEALA